MSDHWNRVYQEKDATRVSWFQERPAVSLELISQTGVDPAAPLLDAGGGTSNLVDYLLQLGFSALTVLDIAAPALESSRARLGAAASTVTWKVGDVTTLECPTRFALWHDRAVFHFLVEAAERARYRETLRRCVLPGGHVIIATFGPEGPARCSDLEVRRYDSALLHQELGTDLILHHTRLVEHLTPSGKRQQFCYCWFQVPK